MIRPFSRSPHGVIRAPIPDSRIPALAVATLLACGGPALPDAEAAGSLPLKVLALDPAPNYAPTRDKDDGAQLTDGIYQRSPIWTRRGSVGWVNQTPVAVTIEATTGADTAYTLVLRSAYQSRADVMPPRRMDIYCGSRLSSAWRHTGSLVHAANDAADGNVVDLVVPFMGCGEKQLQVVIHADGAFVMLDEITLATAAVSGDARLQVQKSPANIHDPCADSTQRLEAGLLQAGLRTLGNTLDILSGTASHAGLAAPWQSLDRPLTAAYLRLQTLPDMGGRFVIGLTNPAAVPRRFTIEALSGPVTATRIQRLSAGLAANGRVVYDVIDEPVVAGEEIVLEPHSLAFAFISEPKGAPSGVRRWRVGDDTGWAQTLTVEVHLQDHIRPTVADKPRVLVWTYPSDAPIWSPANAQETATRLSAAGVNLFEVHPSSLPQPFAENDWPARTQALRKTLALYRGRGLVLLFLGADGWQRLATMNDDQVTHGRLEKWLTVLATTVREAGYGMDDWALYPLDEPHGTQLDQLADVIDTLHSIQPALRFYANPIAGRALETSTVWRLRSLRGRIDYWQPRAGEAFARTREILGNEANTKAELWLYANPPEPARSALPACYRDLGRLAFDEGAHGMGFWSFSDTEKSSAWSDFDGSRPDWSVVYEGRNGAGFVTSRRWEAFVQGIADHAALRYCARSASGDLITAEQCRHYRAALDSLRPDCTGWW